MFKCKHSNGYARRYDIFFCGNVIFTIEVFTNYQYDLFSTDKVQDEIFDMTGKNCLNL